MVTAAKTRFKAGNATLILLIIIFVLGFLITVPVVSLLTVFIYRRLALQASIVALLALAIFVPLPMSLLGILLIHEVLDRDIFGQIIEKWTEATTVERKVEGKK